MNVVRLALDNISKYGEYVFLQYNGRKYTNVELELYSNRLGHGLQQRGLQRDERVLVFLHNMPEVLISYYAILRVGATLVPVNPQLGIQELAYIIDHSEATMIICSTRLAETVRQAQNLATTESLVIVVGEGSPRAFIPIEDCYVANDELLMVDRPGDAGAAIIYTSGTTGVPKGVILTHLNLYMEGHSDIQVMGLFSSDGNRLIEEINMLVVLPLTHVYGLCTMAVAYLTGGTMFLLPSFNVEQILECIQTNKITVFGGIPAMYAALSAYPQLKDYDISSVARWLCGAVPLSADTRRSFESNVQNTILEGYGLTETVTGFSLQRHDRLIKPGSVGQPVACAEVRVVDDQGKPLPPGHIGEFSIKGTNVMKGYYKNEKETARVIRDGWLFTGDIGYMDEDGDIFLIERKNDLIKSSGLTIFPSEVEEVLCSHPDIAEAAVLGTFDQQGNEQVSAFIVLKAGAQNSPAIIQDYCRESLAEYKIPRCIKFCNSLPRNELGRILRKELKAQKSRDINEV